jgi:hypothetical protein
MLVRSFIRGNAAAAKSRCLSQVEKHYVVDASVILTRIIVYGLDRREKKTKRRGMGGGWLSPATAKKG